MYTLEVLNSYGERYELTHQNGQYSVVRISGLLPTKNHINISTAGTMPGGRYNSHHIEPRNIVITLILEGDIEANRQQIYKIFPQDEPVTIYFKNRNRNVWISGYVEAPSGDPFTLRETIQVSVICPDPYWRDVSDIEIETSDELSMFSFPFSIAASTGVPISEEYGHPVSRIINDGDAEIGFLCTLRIETDDEPTLTRTTVQSGTPEEIMGSTVLVPEYSGSYDGFTVYVNNVVQTSGFTYDYVTYQDRTVKLKLHFAAGHRLNIGNTVRVDFYRLEDVEEQRSSTETQNTTHEADPFALYCDFAKPSWYSNISGKTMTFTQEVSGETVPLDMDKWAYDDTGNSIHVYATTSSGVYGGAITLIISGTETLHNQKVTKHSESVTVTLPQDIFFQPFSNYDHLKDLMRVYMGTDKLIGWSTEDVSISDNTTEVCMHLGRTMIDTVTVEIIKSVSGENIKNYTDMQVDEGFLLVDNLTISNTTTNESMSFSGVKFRSGDVLEISTIPNDLHCTVVESDWMTPGTSLLYSAYKTGTFFRLIPGSNVISISADTHPDYISAEFSAQQLYAGV
jgi:hypothetical protein